MCQFHTVLQNHSFYNLGRYVVMSIVQGGNGFPFLAEPVYDYLCTGRCTGISVGITTIPDPTLQFVVTKVHGRN